MTGKRLHVFYTIANHMNISKAAEELYTSQPYLSRELRKLEEEIGLPLFYRSNKLVALTPAGQKLYDGYVFLSNEYNSLLASIEAMKSPQDNHLKVGFMSGVFVDKLPGVIYNFQQKQRPLSIEYKSLSSTAILESLMKKNIDICIAITFGKNAPKTVQQEVLSSSNLHVAVHKDHPFVKKDQITIKMLEGQNYIHLSNDKAPLIFPGSKGPFLLDKNIFNFVTEAEDMSSALSLVQSGAGITLVSKILSSKLNSYVKFIPLSGFDCTNFSIMWSKDDEKPLYLDFVDYIKKNYSPIIVH